MNVRNLDDLVKQIETLETRQAFQEDTIESLDKVIIQQQKDIDRLVLKIGFLEQRIEQSVNTASEVTEEEPPPPHY